MIRLTTQEHGTTSPISATELKTVLDDASYLHLERHPFGPLPEYESAKSNSPKIGLRKQNLKTCVKPCVILISFYVYVHQQLT